MIDRINRVALRSVWRHEAHDFTTWLTDNIDVVSEVIGEELSNAEREQSTGNFNVDINEGEIAPDFLTNLFQGNVWRYEGVDR